MQKHEQERFFAKFFNAQDLLVALFEAGIFPWSGLSRQIELQTGNHIEDHV